MSRIFEVSPIPNHKITNGIKAIVGMGRNTANRGLKTNYTTRFIPISSPKGTAVRMAAKKPNMVRYKLVRKC